MRGDSLFKDAISCAMGSEERRRRRLSIHIHSEQVFVDVIEQFRAQLTSPTCLNQNRIINSHSFGLFPLSFALQSRELERRAGICCFQAFVLNFTSRNLKSLLNWSKHVFKLIKKAIKMRKFYIYGYRY